MGDMAEVFREAAKVRREERGEANTAKLAALGIRATEQDKFVLRIEVERGTVMYYPSGGTWQFKGKVRRGSAEHLLTYLKKEHDYV
jgi:hypothetical protein